MGKKTTAYITGLEEYQEKFKQHCLNYIRTCENLIKLDVQQYNLEEKWKARRAVLRQQANNVQAAFEKLCDTDAEHIKLVQDINAFNEIARGMVKGREDAALTAQYIAETMGSRITAFETYINKKAKSKNPFKSKKSIPAARDFIEVSKTFLDAAKEHVKDAMKMTVNEYK